MKRAEALSLEGEGVSSQLMEDVEACADSQAVKVRAADSSSLVGEVLDSAPAESSGRVMVRWRMLDGTLHKRSVSVVKGLALERGDLVLLHRAGNWPEWLVIHVIERKREPTEPDKPGHRGTGETKLDVNIGDKRIEIEGRDEIVLRCGQASITLRRNGRVIVRGTYVESRSKGTNRIKGGVVLIN